MLFYNTQIIKNYFGKAILKFYHKEINTNSMHFKKRIASAECHYFILFNLINYIKTLTCI